jgi:hypothetical protein
MVMDQLEVFPGDERHLSTSKGDSEDSGVLNGLEQTEILEVVAEELRGGGTRTTATLLAEARTRLANLEPDALEPLIEMMVTGNDDQSEWAVQTANESGLNVVTLIGSRLQTEDDLPRIERSIQILGDSKDAKAVAQLFAFLLKGIGHCEAEERKPEAHKTDFVKIMGATCKAIGRLGPTPTQMHLLLSRVSHAGKFDKVWMNKAFGEIGDPAAVDYLKNRLESEREPAAVRGSAAASLVKILGLDAAEHLFSTLLVCEDERTAGFLQLTIGRMILRNRDSQEPQDPVQLSKALTRAIETTTVDQEQGLKRVEFLRKLERRASHPPPPRKSRMPS